MFPVSWGLYIKLESAWGISGVGIRPLVKDLSLTHPAAQGFKTRANICCKNSKESVYSSTVVSSQVQEAQSQRRSLGLSRTRHRDCPAVDAELSQHKAWVLSSPSGWSSWARSHFQQPGDKGLPKPRVEKKRWAPVRKERRRAMTQWSSPRRREGPRFSGFPFT